jgi:hypothetical protein
MAGALAGLRRRAHEAERAAHAAYQEARRAAAGVSSEAETFAEARQCAQDAERAWQRCGERARLVNDACRVPPYADRYELRDAAQDAQRHVRHAELASHEAVIAADGARRAAKRAGVSDRPRRTPPRPSEPSRQERRPMYMRFRGRG